MKADGKRPCKVVGIDVLRKSKSIWEKVYFIISSRSLDSPQGDSLEVTISSLRTSLSLSISLPSLSVADRLHPSPTVSSVSNRLVCLRLSSFVKFDGFRFVGRARSFLFLIFTLAVLIWFTELSWMDNEDTMNLEDTDYMSGDELMDQNPDEDEAVMKWILNLWRKLEKKLRKLVKSEFMLLTSMDSHEMKLKIHFGGSMKKIGDVEDNEYLGELGSKNVDWKTDDIVWDMLVDFCKEEALIRAPLGLIWCNSEKEEMKELRYVYDRYDGEMCQLRSTSKSEIDVVEVFVEHECSEHIPGVIQLSDTNRDDAECGDEEEEHSENDVVDRPKEDDEPEESEDEKPAENETGEEDNPTGIPKPPSTRRRKTQNIGSSSHPVHATGASSQPVHATESSSQPVEATGSSSQPVEATGSSSDPKPHPKKPSQGPLKVRKTANIPHAVGTLWSPFTNRPFEVFGDRVYDRSDLNPQPPPQE
ncbi:hypothetical protein YC2023_037632 [Brassica napus]